MQLFASGWSRADHDVEAGRDIVDGVAHLWMTAGRDRVTAGDGAGDLPWRLVPVAQGLAMLLGGWRIERVTDHLRAGRRGEGRGGKRDRGGEPVGEITM